MRIVFILFTLPLILLASDVDATLQKLLHYKASKTILHVNYNPFFKKSTLIDGKVQTIQKNNTIELKAIFNDKAFITNKWYAKGESIAGYKIYNVDAMSVVLKKGSEFKTLQLAQADKIMKIKDK